MKMRGTNRMERQRSRDKGKGQVVRSDGEE